MSTQKKIGPSFSGELKIAGLMGLSFSWGDDGELSYSDAMTADEIAGVEAVYEAHDPSASASE